MRLSLAASLLVLGALLASGAAQEGSPHDRLAREIFQELVEIDTTDARGDVTKAAEAMAARLRRAGWPAEDVQVIGPHPRKGNLVARLRGRGTGKPILLLAHLDVVDARPEDWSPHLHPFTFIERDGYFYGRGTTDDKAMAAIWVATLLRLKQEGFVPERDLVMALTADEEGGDHNGVQWLLAHHRALIDAEFCLNEGGGGKLRAGRRLFNAVQAAEKVYLSFQLEVQNPGGHSSLPVKDNAIYRLAAGLTRLAAYEFPVALNEITRTYFARMAEIETGDLAAAMRALLKPVPDPAAVERLSRESAYYNALLRTTCVATRLEAGHADNALPQRARALVNCRLLPGTDPREVEGILTRVLADPAIAVRPVGTPTPSPPSPLRPDLLKAIESITAELWPGVPVIPTMSTGATDGLYLRNAGIPVYGVDGLFTDMDDVRAHGKDERIGVQAFYEGREFLYRLVKRLSGR